MYWINISNISNIAQIRYSIFHLHLNDFLQFICDCHVEFSNVPFVSLTSTCVDEWFRLMDCCIFCLAWSVIICCKTSSILFPSHPFRIQMSRSGIQILNNNSTFLLAAPIWRRSLLNFIWVDDLPGLKIIKGYTTNQK